MTKAKQYKEHELSKFFPMLDANEYVDLLDDIEENGQLRAITLYNGEVLDGRNRLKAVTELGIKPIFESYDGDHPLKYVVSANMRRRHLTSGQKALVTVAVHEYLEANERNTEFPETRNRADVAKIADVAPSTISAARAIHRDHPKLATQVMNKEISITRAAGLRQIREIPNISKAQVKQATVKAEEFKDRDVVALATEIQDGITKQGKNGFKQVMRMSTEAIKEHVGEFRPEVRRKKKPKVKKDVTVSWLQNSNVTDVLDWAAESRRIWKLRLEILEGPGLDNPSGLVVAVDSMQKQVDGLSEVLEAVRFSASIAAKKNGAKS